jgi:hypothetical protein
VVLGDLLQLQAVRDFLWSHGCHGQYLTNNFHAELHTSRQILLVGKHQQQRILHFPVLDDPCELGPRLLDAVAVVRVDDEDESLGSCALLAAVRG